MIQVKFLVFCTVFFALIHTENVFAQEGIAAIKAYPVGNPHISYNIEYEVVRWTNAAITELLTIEPNNYRQSVEYASRNLSSSGWNDFIKTMQSSGIPEMIEANQQSLTAKLGTAKLWGEDKTEDDSILNLEFPVTLIYKSLNADKDGNFRIREDVFTIRVTIKSEKTELGLYPQIVSFQAIGKKE